MLFAVLALLVSVAYGPGTVAGEGGRLMNMDSGRSRLNRDGNN